MINTATEKEKYNQLLEKSLYKVIDTSSVFYNKILPMAQWYQHPFLYIYLDKQINVFNINQLKPQ